MPSSSETPKEKEADVPDIHAASIDELHEAFDLYDTKGAGEIPMSELVDSMQTLGFQDKNPMMYEMMLKIQKEEEGGSTNFAHFAEGLANQIRNVQQEKDVRMIFNMLDTEKTGRISLENLKKVANEFGDTVSDTELMEMLDTAKYVNTESLGDVNEQLSNEVFFTDFYNLMTKGKSSTTSNTPDPFHGTHGRRTGGNTIGSVDNR